MMDFTDEPSDVASGPAHDTEHDSTKGQPCEPESRGSATGPLEARREPTASHDKRWTTTTWTTVYVGASTKEHTRTTTKTAWTETLDTSTSGKDPWVTKWVTETVAGPATDPTWTTVVVASSTTSTTTTTLTPATTPAGTVTAMHTLENGASSGGLNFGLWAFVGVVTLAVVGLSVGFLWLLHYCAESPGKAVRSVYPVPVVAVQGDGQGRGDIGEGRGEFYGKA